MITLPVVAQAPGAKMVFKGETDVNMGVYRQGEEAVHYFEFTNTGTQALQIYEVRTTCSCTASEFPEKPVKPGESAKIKVTFDTHDKLGTYDKGVNIYSNAGEANLIITITVTERL